MEKAKKLLLGELLINKKIITEKQLREALAEQKKSGELLGQIIVEKGWADEDRVYRILSEHINIPFQSLLNVQISPDVISLVSESTARSYYFIPVKKEEDTLTVAMTEPQNIFVIDKLRSLVGFKINPKSGDLVISWYDARDSPDGLKAEYYYTYVSATVGDKLAL